MTIKWIHDKFEWGERYISGETQCMIENHNERGVQLYNAPGMSVRESRPFDTVRAAKAYVNKLPTPPAPTK